MVTSFVSQIDPYYAPKSIPIVQGTMGRWVDDAYLLFLNNRYYALKSILIMKLNGVLSSAIRISIYILIIYNIYFL